MHLQSFCHPTLIHCTCGPQTLSPLASEPGGTPDPVQTGSVQGPPSSGYRNQPSRAPHPTGCGPRLHPGTRRATRCCCPGGPSSPAPGPLPAGMRTRAGEGTPAKVCTKRSGSDVSVIAV